MWGGGGRPRCRALDPLTWGADAFYDIVDSKLVFKSHYKMSAPQTDTENCVAHNGSLIPVPGRDIFAQAWYQGGLSIVDFTDSSNPVEIAFFDRGPLDEEELITAGYWSTYWYGGHIYATEIARGLDVFSLEASDYLSENEIAAASLQDANVTVNAQTQERVTWPAVPVVARAYVDQLQRDENVDTQELQALRRILDEAESLLDNSSSNSNIASDLDDFANSMQDQSSSNSGIKRGRYISLASTLRGIAGKIR